MPSGAARVLALDHRDLRPELNDLLSDYRPDIIAGFCSYIARVLAHLSPAVSEMVKRVELRGEMLSAAFETTLRDQFPRAELFEKYMALEVGGYIGNRFCASLPRGSFHPVPGVSVEIVDPDEEGIGDIVVSKRVFRSVRLDRYRIGDIGCIIPGECACGESVTFELLGRRDMDHIRLGGALLTRNEFDRVIGKFPDLIDDYRVEARRGGQATEWGTVRLRIFRRAMAGTPELARELADRISRSLFVTRTKTFHDLAASGVLEPLEVVYVDTPFERAHKDIKLRAV
jgi:phenylacetate-coenzyme A ligase PaaK-like adenylate-forming protein